VFHFSIVIKICGKDFQPSPSMLISRNLAKVWKPGDFALPSGRGRQFDDSGVLFRVLDRFDQYDWEDSAKGPLGEVCELIWQNGMLMQLPTPVISFWVKTDGEDYPPLYLGRELMKEIERIKAEIDIDIIASL
jgi:hypothetical protein